MDNSFVALEVKVKLDFYEDVLGGRPMNDNLLSSYIESKAPEGKSIEDEIKDRGTQAVLEDKLTGYSKTDDKYPHIWDYQIKGYFKESIGVLKKVEGSACSKQKAHKKFVDNFMFIKERSIYFEHEDGTLITKDELIINERPLRASTPMGERVSIARSESVPAPCSITFTIQLFDKNDWEYVKEALDYGQFKGFGQWRNGSYGRFHWTELK